MSSERVFVAVVVIGRDEATHLESVLTAARSLAKYHRSIRIVYVDSDSTDRSVEIACRHADAVYRYRGSARSAAAGRTVGTQLTDSDYILYLDGDSVIHGDWFQEAVAYLESHETVGAVYGGRREVYEGVADGFVSAGPRMGEYALGGNALYRRGALDAAGGFHPFLVSNEERELAQRVLLSGFAIERVGGCMVTHKTVPKDTVVGFWRRIKRGMVLGEGQVLRTSLGTPTFAAHLRYSDRKVLVLLYLMGLVPVVVSAALAGSVTPVAAWAAVGSIAFVLLSWKRRSVRSAATIVGDWITAGIGGLLGFMRGVPSREAFDPLIEPLAPAGAAFRLGKRRDNR